MSALAPTLQAYFTERLIGQRAASPNTIGAYKLTFRLLLAFASKRTAKTPVTLDTADLVRELEDGLWPAGARHAPPEDIGPERLAPAVLSAPARIRGTIE